MKRVAVSLMAVAGLVTMTSCEKVVGEGPVITQARTATNFKGIAVGIPGTVNYAIDPVYKVEIQAQQNILDVIQTSVNGDELLIKVKDGKRLKEHENITVNISGPTADFIHLSGSGDVNITGPLNTVNCNLRVSGSGTITAQQLVITDKLSANINGSGDIRLLSGTIKNESLKISGSGQMNLENVVGEKGVTDISGSGDIFLHLTQTLDATISGSGSVVYKGSPVVSTHVSGSGRVRPF